MWREAGLPRYQPDAVIANWKMIDVLKEFGDRREFTLAQVAMVFLFAHKPFVVPISGTTKLAHLQENLAAAKFAFLSDELKSLTDQLSAIKITGNRL